MAKLVVLDVETKIIDGSPSPHRRGAAVVLYGVADKDSASAAPEAPLFFDAISKALREGHVVIGGHNLTFDLCHLLRAHPQFIRTLLRPDITLWDTQIVEYLLEDCGAPWLTLEDACAKNNVPYTKDDWAAAAFKTGNGADILCAEDPERLKKYCAADARATYATAKEQARRIKETRAELTRVVQTQMAALKLVVLMEHFGMPLNGAALSAARKQSAEDVTRATWEMRSALMALLPPGLHIAENSDDESGFNVDSPKQLATLLFGGEIEYKRRVPAGAFKSGTKTGQPRYRIERHVITFPAILGHAETRSTDENALQSLQVGAAPEAVKTVARAILSLRNASKRDSTFYAPMAVAMESNIDSRLHGSFNMAATNTGRKSSSNPNLQNLPESARHVIAADKGRTIMTADAKQLEMVGAGYLSQDARLVDDLKTGIDIHGVTKKRADKDTGRDIARTDVKRINFGRVYGGGPKTLSAQSGVPIEIVRMIVKALDSRYPMLASFWERLNARLTAAQTPIASEAGTQEYASRLVLPTGRGLRFSTFNGTYSVPQMKNRPIQSFATADIVPYIEMRLVEFLQTNQELVLCNSVRPIAVVHDEIVLDVDEAGARLMRKWFEDMARTLVQDLSSWYALKRPLDIPIELKVGVGESWASAKG